MPKGYKAGGRQKGTPNRITNDIRKRLRDIILDEIENIGPDLKLVEPKDRLNYIPKILPYVVSKNPVDKDPDQVPEWKEKFESMSLAQKKEALRKLNTKKKNDKKKKK